MRSLFGIVTVAILALTNPGAHAASGVTLDWADLPDPSAQVFEDPYRDLSPEQLDDVLFTLRLRSRLQQDVGGEENRKKWQDLLAETEMALAEDDIDVDWLVTQREIVAERRELAATAGNPRFDGETITLSGYAIPAPADADGRPVAYLVPQRGMCSHLPPPPPNQMIRVRLKGDWVPDYFHVHVRLTGKLTIDPSDQRMMVVDGIMPMYATFQLDADRAEVLETPDDRLDWLQSFSGHIRATDNRKTGGTTSTE